MREILTAPNNISSRVAGELLERCGACPEDKSVETIKDKAGSFSAETASAWLNSQPGATAYARHVRTGRPIGRTETLAHFVASAGITPEGLYQSLVEWYPELFERSWDEIDVEPRPPRGRRAGS